jgi:hypothetical protein
MPISDKTRKLLWGRSGSRCAKCKRELVVDATATDDESVVGDECHIVSPRANGPRGEYWHLAGDLDAYDNLILLCRVHHKLVDDQPATFTVDALRKMKREHEVWVLERLQEQDSRARVRRVKQNIPAILPRLTSGREVLAIIEGAMASSLDHDELVSQEEVDLVGGFLQTVHDWGDVGADMKADERVQVAYDLTRSLAELEEAGFLVFGGREVQLLEGGAQAEPWDWPVAILRVLRKTNEAIMGASVGGPDDGMPQRPEAGDPNHVEGCRG